MKSLITMLACTMLLLSFLLEYVQGQHIALQIGQVERLADLYCQAEGINDLRKEVSRVMGCSTEDILVTMDESPNGTEPVTSYRMEIPVKKILAVPEFWGIEGEKNQGVYIVERDVSYE